MTRASLPDKRQPVQVAVYEIDTGDIIQFLSVRPTNLKVFEGATTAWRVVDEIRDAKRWRIGPGGYERRPQMKPAPPERDLAGVKAGALSAVDTVLAAAMSASTTPVASAAGFYSAQAAEAQAFLKTKLKTAQPAKYPFLAAHVSAGAGTARQIAATWAGKAEKLHAANAQRAAQRDQVRQAIRTAQSASAVDEIFARYREQVFQEVANG